MMNLRESPRGRGCVPTVQTPPARARVHRCVPAVFLSVLALPVGFCGHALERLVADLHCDPTAWLLQPTAVLHWGAGLAIVGGYVQTHAMHDAAEAA